jgi:alkanesulfonate monooxygenase
MPMNSFQMEEVSVSRRHVIPQQGLQVFSTCPSSMAAPDDYAERVIRAARWSEQAGCTGMLIYTDNSHVDPWLVAQLIISSTHSQCPLVAVQPVYMHPFAVAKMVSSLAFLFGRRVYLNMVAGGFKNELAALNDITPHDDRYERLVEYTLIVRGLLEGNSPLTFEGQFYRVKGAILQPRMVPELFPGVLVSGSSGAGQAAAFAMGAVAVKYPEPPDQCTAHPSMRNSPCGVRVGLIARADENEAWRVAFARFPEDRKGQITYQFAMKVSDSAWHKRLSETGAKLNGQRDTYWLRPFETYQTFCPYLVGSYERVASELARYMAAGYRTYILDIPAAEEEFEHAGAVFQMAAQSAGL